MQRVVVREILGVVILAVEEGGGLAAVVAGVLGAEGAAVALRGFGSRGGLGLGFGSGFDLALVVTALLPPLPLPPSLLPLPNPLQRKGNCCGIFL